MAEYIKLAFEVYVCLAQIAFGIILITGAIWLFALSLNCLWEVYNKRKHQQLLINAKFKEIEEGKYPQAKIDAKLKKIEQAEKVDETK